MRNKGLVILMSVLLFLVCAFYLSFSFVTAHYSDKAEQYAQGDKQKEYFYLDSISNEKVWLGYTLKECREKEINLGLDLKGGMNVTMEISVPDILRALSDYNTSENFTKAMADAVEAQRNSTDDFVTLFIRAFETNDPNARLSSVFSTFELKDKITLNSTNEEVEKVIREEVQAAIDNSFNVLRTRIDRFGVIQPNIQKLDVAGRILIELPGVKEPERVRKLLQGTANLEFWETYEINELYPQIEQLNQVIADRNALLEENAAPAVAEEPKAEEAPAEVAQEVKADSTDSLIGQFAQTTEETTPEASSLDIEEFKKNNPLIYPLNMSVARGPVVGAVLYTDTANVMSMLHSPEAQGILPRDVKFAWTVKPIDEAGTMYQLIALKVTNRDGRAPLEGDAITDARMDFGQFSSYAEVNMEMNAEGSKTWARLTKDNIGKSIAVVLDGYVYSYPTVQTEITGGRSQITGNFTPEEATDLANTLKSGKMPAPARIIQEDIVGPSLGQESINAGLISFIIAFCLILIYMVFYYGLIPGLIADTALLLNVFLLLGILASFSAVLTLPGIAGIVLTMGTAVDANVLIYERIREELRGGKNMRRAINDGFKGAISAIVDANVTSLLTGIVLAVFGTGPIKGFAVTYIIGIISSFLTAVFVTRLLLDLYASRENAKELSFTTNITKDWLQNTHFDFINSRKIAYIISGTLVVISIIGLIPNALGELNFGIDFSGGRNYVIRFAEPVQPEEISALLEDEFDGTSVTVITIGNQNQVRVSTKYGIERDDDQIDTEIEQRLYKGLSEKLGGISFEEFSNGSDEGADKIGIMSSQKVGPSIADDIKSAAVWAIIFALIIIFLYILIRFLNVNYSFAALVALAHDTVIVLGLYAILWRIMPFSMEIDQSFIAAILTVIGYSINDTVVIFDRIREYRGLYPKRDLAENMNNALNSTLARTFNTSMSTFLVLLAIFVFGGETIQGFVFALMIGVIVGTYSSLFIASPIAYDTRNWTFRKKKAEVAEK
ncbi:MAG: protein translocase subunit SecDF [Paludibacteraceae bacterium]|nr:protein translocase subunit SecDF [Paludibacteraceae bacterium]